MKKWISFLLLGMAVSASTFAQEKTWTIVTDGGVEHDFTMRPTTEYERRKYGQDKKWYVYVNPDAWGNSYDLVTFRDPSSPDFWRGLDGFMRRGKKGSSRARIAFAAMAKGERERADHERKMKEGKVSGPVRYSNYTVGGMLNVLHRTVDEADDLLDAKDSKQEQKEIKQDIKALEKINKEKIDTITASIKNLRRNIELNKEVLARYERGLERGCNWDPRKKTIDPPSRLKDRCERKKRNYDEKAAEIKSDLALIEMREREIASLVAATAPTKEDLADAIADEKAAREDAKRAAEEVERGRIDTLAAARAKEAEFDPNRVFCCPDGTISSRYPGRCEGYDPKKEAQVPDLTKVFPGENKKLLLGEVCDKADDDDNLCQFENLFCMYSTPGRDGFSIPFTAPTVQCILDKGGCEKVSGPTACAKKSLSLWAFKTYIRRNGSSRKIDINERLRQERRKGGRKYDVEGVEATEAK